ncbi:hypothetical protein EGW08_018581, partial [Elysia chlorotica]
CLYTKAHCKDVDLKPVDCNAAGNQVTTTSTGVTNPPVATNAPGTVTTNGMVQVNGTADVPANTFLTTTTATATLSNLGVVCQTLLANPCPPDNSPVCASDLVSYANLCEYTKARCLKPGLTVVQQGACTAITTPAPDVAGIVCNALAASACFDDAIVLCGSDGITYSNSCLFE